MRSRAASFVQRLRRFTPPATLALLLAGGTCPAAEPARAAKAPAAPKSAPASLVVHVDPKTMRLGLHPGTGTVPLELTADVLDALNTSSEGLKPVTKDGVTRVDLEGRFRPVWIAVADAEGRVHPVCLTSLPPDVEEAARAVRAANAAGGRK